MRRAPTGQRTFYINADTSEIDSLMDGLGNDIEEAIRPATQAGAQVFYEAVQQNVRSLGTKTGNLYGSIYQAYSPEKSPPGVATYNVSWRTSGSGIRAPHGHLIEFGHIQKYAAYIGSDGNWYTAMKDGKPVLRAGGPQQIAARPFIRPAATSAKEAAVTAMKTKLFEVLDAR